MSKRTHERPSEFLFGAVARNIHKPVTEVTLLGDAIEPLGRRLFSGGPGVVEACRLPSRWMQTLHEDAERWDGLA